MTKEDIRMSYETQFFWIFTQVAFNGLILFSVLFTARAAIEHLVHEFGSTLTCIEQTKTK
jgi:hypothetical protein